MATQSNVLDGFDVVMAEQADDIHEVASLVSAIHKAESDIEGKEANIADLLRDVLLSQGVLTFAWFEMVRLAFGDNYRKIKTGASDDAVDKAWSRAFGAVTSYYKDVAKPKSTSAKAEQKRAERETKEAEMLAAYGDMSVSELRDNMKAQYNKAGDGNKEAKKEADKIAKVIDIKTKAEQAEAKDQLKEMRAYIASFLKQVTDFDVLAEVLDLLRGSVDDAEALL